MTARETDIVVWIVLATVLVGCEVVAVIAKGAMPRIDDLVGWLTAGRTRRYLLLLGWMWLGWHVFAR